MRYTRNFNPSKYHMRDEHTLLLLHFDTDTPSRFKDDSGRGRHGTPYRKPKLKLESR